MLNFLFKKTYAYYPPFHHSINLMNRLPRRGLENLKVLNVGVGEGNSALATQLYYVKFKQLDIIDIFQPYLDRAQARTWATENVNFLLSDIRYYDTKGYDIVLMFDVLEHLPQEDSLRIMDKIKCAQVIFIPLEKHYRPNVYGAKSQDHLSLWNEGIFRNRGYKTEVLKNFHTEGGETFDALWALKKKLT